ncbi:MAG: multidrug efflux pump subunit AcrB [Verrucomicrobiales bacterium]|jgi:multidrug efflux pump subunit AcrB
MIAWFAKNSVAANLLLISLLTLGLWSATTQLTLEVFPDSDVNTVSISVPFRGNSPEEVEEGIVLAIEEAIEDLTFIDKMRSTASESSGTVTIEIKEGHDPRAALDDIKSRVDAIITFPAEAEKPTVSLQETTDSVIKVLVAGELDEFQLRDLADEIHAEILNLTAESNMEFPRWLPLDKVPVLGWTIKSLTTKTQNITSASIVGVRPYEISIEVSEQTLLRYDLTLDEVASKVREQSVDLSGGVIKTEGGEILLRTKARSYVGSEFREIVIRSNPDGTRVTLGDLGVVDDGFEEAQVTARFNGKPCVLVSVNRIGDQNAILISDTVKDYVEAKRGSLPNGVELTAWRDRSRIVEGRLGTLIESALLAFVLVFVILALFLRISLAGWVVLGIPVAFAGALICMPSLGATINISSLFGFILVLGIVVDDAIVTGENIFEHLKKNPDPLQAAIEGTHEIATPVIFGVLTTIVAFIPLLMMGGHRGSMFKPIPYVVIPVLIFSLIESKLILPAHLKHIRNLNKPPARYNFISRGQQAVARSLEWFIKRVYQPFLEFCLVNRWITASVFVAILILTAGWVFSGNIQRVTFPRIPSDYVTVKLSMPSGTPYAVTAKYVDQMEEAAEKLQKKYITSKDVTVDGVEYPKGTSLIEHIFSSTGGQGIVSSGGHRGGSIESGQTHVGELTFGVIDPELRREMTIDLGEGPIQADKFSSPGLSMELRRLIGQIPGAEDFNVRAEIGRFGDPIDVRIFGQDPEMLAAAAGEIEKRLAEFDGLFDINSNVSDGKEEIRLRVRPEAELLGIDSDDLARQTRGAFYGFEAQRIQRGREDIRVMIRYPREERASVGNLQNMRIRTPEGARIPFANVAELDFGRSAAAIRRSDRNRTVNVVADADKQNVDLEGIKADIEKLIPEIVAKYPGVNYSMEGESAEQREANSTLLLGMLFAAFTIYCLLAIPFKSFAQPLLVMIVIPFGVAGAVFGHILVEDIKTWVNHPLPSTPLSFMSLFGMIALSGVVVNDSLVLVDWINRKRDEGVNLLEAVRAGGGARFRPIILTSLTTFAGLAPLIFERSTQAQFLIPMAVSLGFGILFATAVTLILVPVNYLLLEDIKSSLRWLRRWYTKPFST